MTDVVKIQELISSFAEAGSRRNWDNAVATFAPDGTWELTGSEHRLKGHAELRAGFPKFVEGTEYLLQMNAPAIISVDGARATARSLIREGGKMKDLDEWIDILGSYEDRLIRMPQGWRFAHRAFTMFGMARTPTLRNATLPVGS